MVSDRLDDELHNIIYKNLDYIINNVQFIESKYVQCIQNMTVSIELIRSCALGSPNQSAVYLG